MEANPYAAPRVVVDDARAYSARDLENRKAGRDKRLMDSLPVFGNERRCPHDLIVDTIVIAV